MGAVSYIAKRVGLYIAVVFIGLSLTFVLPRLMPVDPVEGYIAQLTSLANAQYSAEAIDELRHNLRRLYGLEGSVVQQYFDYMKRVLIDFDFGPSFTYFPSPVGQMIANSLPWTMGLLITATIISWVVGNAVGIVAGYFDKGKTGAILELVGVILYPIPYYILAVSLIIIFGYLIPIFPLTTTFPVGELTFQKAWIIFYNSVLPAITIVLGHFGFQHPQHESALDRYQGRAVRRLCAAQGHLRLDAHEPLRVPRSCRRSPPSPSSSASPSTGPC